MPLPHGRAAPLDSTSPDAGAAGLRTARRQERDRFVALAFCAADLLFELDGKGRILFAGGATKLLAGRTQEELVGTDFPELIAAADRAVVRRVLARARGGERFDHVAVRLAGGARPQLSLVMRGYQLPDLDGHGFLALRIQEPVRAPPPVAKTSDPVTGMLVPDAFTSATMEAMAAAAAAGEEVELTLLSLGDLGELRSRLDAEARDELAAQLAASLRASSLGGDTATRLDDERFGVVHRRGANLERLKAEILEAARAADPAGQGLKLSLSSVALDGDARDPAQTARLLKYTIARYCERAEGDFRLTSLSEGLTAVTEETVGRMERLSHAIDKGAFSVVYQPICDLLTLRPHHFEALVRFDKTTLGINTFEIITFAEEVGLICALDLAMCRRVLASLERLNASSHRYVVAVNLSALSLATPDFMRDLAALLATAGATRERIMFEITESAKVPDLAVVNSSIQALRRSGHLVCLDDLGAGEAAFRYLSQLDVDVAKIDGQFVRGSLASAKGKALLQAMASACRDLGIMTIGEMIEDDHHARIARECGVQYGQGYLFGRPAGEITSFEAPRPLALKRKADAAAPRSAKGS